MPRQYKCISSDGHIDLNPDIWRDRVQAKWRDRAPKRVKMPNGSDAVVIDSGKPNTIGITRSVRVPHAELGAVFELFDRVVHTGGRNRAHAHQPVRRRRHIFLGKKLVVGANAVAIKVVVFGLAQNERNLGK